MASGSETLDVVAGALRAASGIVGGHAEQVASSVGSLSGSLELSGVAAAAMHAGLGEYCGAFGQRLWSVSAALVVASGGFAAMEEANSAALASVDSVPVP
ncbi:hypothetical protein MSIMFI_04677 [Mycobacterium simulans]|uniref:hypothetical protein n=1 Tax=Mycobacterium simulans TaxID=627089 RepID=UPI00174B4565|nr:hypothetical protein [Mycobacterium simulans]SON63147.1 hypothetical protein MSIMFI_04677 [Mycobacterium simulans]